MTDQELARLEARVRQLEDVREINDLVFAWHFACTGGFNGVQSHRMEALDCLSDDALIAESPERPGYGPKGREQYTRHWRYFHGDAGPVPHIFHASVASKVAVDGDAATQVSNMFAILQVRGGAPTVSLTQRNHAFVRTEQGWRMSYRDMTGGFSFTADALHGPLNEPKPAEARTPWKG
jgi:hypothetical protein